MKISLHSPGQRAQPWTPGQPVPPEAWFRAENADSALLSVVQAQPGIRRLHLIEPASELLPALADLSLDALWIQSRAPMPTLRLPAGLSTLRLPGCLFEMAQLADLPPTLEHLDLSGTPLQHSLLPALARHPLRELRLCGVPLLDFDALRAQLEVLAQTDMGARMALSEAWEDVIEFRFDEGHGEPFYVEALPESDPAAIPLPEAQAPQRGDKEPWERWRILADSAEIFSLDLAAMAGPLSGLQALLQMRELRTLDLSRTPFSEPALLAGMPLERLNLAHTQVASLGPIAQLTSLKALDVSGVHLPDLEGLSNLSSLEGLRFSHLALSGPTASHIAACTQLKALALHEVTLAPGSLQALATLPALQQLSLHGSDLREGDLAALGALATLRDVDLTRCALGDAAGLSALTQLRTLSLRKSSLQDADLPHLEALTQLELLALGFTQTTQAPCEALAEKLPGVRVLMAFAE